MEQCYCEDCLESFDPCFCDCNLDEMCIGCREALKIEKDTKFDIDYAIGEK